MFCYCESVVGVKGYKNPSSIPLFTYNFFEYHASSKKNTYDYIDRFDFFSFWKVAHLIALTCSVNLFLGSGSLAGSLYRY